ncbi:glutamate N-acetyltransferase [Pacificibacter maritimus]|uniref:Arginine biosynthesis bifunctional protein ArgJ n=1 Tax=Pacificibacter maritimus TaxID=762213 RepID=A0A3N4UHP8_9RHOB|nr:bifunctional glutamate N-acetyltransferase/amino-acid acetyltransferase ArgJ [Pacificibacter maritimus]RPE64677.1 glutamate N-acetyltransferase [Pacificibacter maritimus]
MAKIDHISPLAPTDGFPNLPVIDGVTFAATAAGVKYQGRTDVMLAQLCAGSVIAGTFTKSSTRSAAVLDCQAKIGSDPTGPAAILVNSGNSNAFTGKNGLDAVHKITQAVSEHLDIAENRVYTSSTGVIGEPLKWDRIIAKIDDLKAGQSAGGIADAAKAIMTTDTFAKGSARSIVIDGEQIKIAGIAKGSGMIAPDMATMLVYIFTDAKIDQDHFQTLVSDCTDSTFNCITVDSDTSTSDTLIAAATGRSNATKLEIDSEHSKTFRTALHEVMLELSHLVVKDGEGATKFVEVQVTNAQTNEDARAIASSIANSPLVKTAVAGEDPNWGRVVMAVGKSGAQADRDLLSIWFGDVLVAENGWAAPSYTEEAGAAHMKNDHIVIRVDIGLGTRNCTMWTCDLTHGYITINADYRS